MDASLEEVRCIDALDYTARGLVTSVVSSAGLVRETTLDHTKSKLRGSSTVPENTFLCLSRLIIASPVNTCDGRRDQPEPGQDPAGSQPEPSQSPVFFACHTGIRLITCSKCRSEGLI